MKIKKSVERPSEFLINVFCVREEFAQSDVPLQKKLLPNFKSDNATKINYLNGDFKIMKRCL